MIVMPTNNCGFTAGYIAGQFPGRIAHLYSPDGWRRPKPFVGYALDNGRFSKTWQADTYWQMLDAAAQADAMPMWALVPDVVGDRDGTLREWDTYAPRVQSYGWPMAFAVQDGMTMNDVPQDAAVVFVGGTTAWKRRTLSMWCAAFVRVHVGRINTNQWLWECHEAGAESCDGTGWFRGDQAQLAGLRSYLDRTSKGLGNPRGSKLWEN